MKKESVQRLVTIIAEIIILGYLVFGFLFMQGILSNVGKVTETASVGRVFYVWGGVGNDAYDGSAMDSSHAWATLAHADDVALPGDTIYVKGKFTTQQSLNNPTMGNGQASAWVTYKPYEDNYVDFVGDDSGIRLDNKAFVEINGLYGTNKRFRFYQGTKFGMYIRAASHNIRITGSDFNPEGLTRRTEGAVRVMESSNNIEIYNNNLRNGFGSTTTTALYIGTYLVLNDANNIYIYNNSIVHDDNNAMDIKDCALCNVEVYNNNIKTIGTSEYAPIEVAGSAKIYDNIIDITSNAANKALGAFYFNKLDNGANSANVYIYRNVIIGGNSQSLVVQTSADWPELTARVYNNIIKNFRDPGYIINFEATNGAAKWYFYHNTFFNSTLSGIEESSSKTGYYYFKNNLYDNWGSYANRDGSSMNSFWEGNYYYKAGVSNNANAFYWDSLAKSFLGIQTIGQELKGTFGINPQLDSSGRLTSSIPIKLDVSSEMSSWPSYNQDIEGKTREGFWDIGAYEYSSSTALPICGNNIIETGEVCDTNNLSDYSCANFGFNSGTLKCSSDCKSFDTSSCYNIDTTLPIITSIGDSPDPLTKGNNITINATVTDNVAVNSAWVVINTVKYMMTYSSGSWKLSHNTSSESGTVSYTVYANDSSGNNANTVSGTYVVSIPTQVIPASPSNLAATSTVKGKVSLTWKDNSLDESGFKLGRSTSLSGTYTLIATLPANTISYTDSGVSSRKTYYYRIRAYNGVGDSGYSNTVSVKVL